MAEPYSRSSFSSRNIVIAGETGVGKSSFINLIRGTNSAATSNDVRGATTHTSAYPWITDTHAFRLWDTPGLCEGSRGSVKPEAAQYALYSLLRKLSKEGGVHLLVLCMRWVAHVTRGMKHTYDIVRRIRDQVSPHIPVVAVITEMDKSRKVSSSNIADSMEAWWSENEGRFTSFRMTFCGHACLTTLTDNDHPPMTGRRIECQRLARNLIINHALPLKLMRNVVVVGELGVGKSSVINLALGSDSAVVGSDVGAVTTHTSYHDWNLSETQAFRFWDTPGLGQSPSGAAPRYALNAIQSLVTKLGRGTGVHLFVICISGRRITKRMKETYDTIVGLRNLIVPDTPIIGVVTELEQKSDVGDGDVLARMERWWLDNAADLSCLAFTAHACITTLADDAHPPISGRQDQCQQRVRDLVRDHALTPTRAHVVLFGETGVGKSSVVNLLVGRPVAEVSSAPVACTTAATEHPFQLGGTMIRLWDTAPLEVESGMDEDAGTGTNEGVAELIRRLNAAGGISHVLFCVRGDQVMTTMRKNYQLFCEVLGKKRVPIALVVTHLERESDMEAWWECHAEELEHNGIRVFGHACITTLERHPKYAESQQAVQGLFWQSKISSDTWPWKLLEMLDALLWTRFLKIRA